MKQSLNKLKRRKTNKQEAQNKQQTSKPKSKLKKASPQMSKQQKTKPKTQAHKAKTLPPKTYDHFIPYFIPSNSSSINRLHLL
jgi:hypothetical protein